MTEQQACMDLEKMTTVLDNMSRIPTDLDGSRHRLMPELELGLDGIGGGSDVLGAAFAAAYHPAADEVMETAESLSDQIGEHVGGGWKSMDDYRAADRAGAQCFPK